MANFEWALGELKDGAKVTRRGWNGPGQWVAMQAGYPEGVAANANMQKVLGVPAGAVIRFRPYLMIRTAQEDYVPWVPTVSDLLAGDWQYPDVVEAT